MTHPLHLRRHPRAVTKFSRLALGVGGAGLGLVALAGMLVPQLWHADAPAVVKETTRDERLILPEVLTRELPIRPVVAPAAPIVQQVTPPSPEPRILPGADPGTASGGAGQLLAALNPFAPAAPEPRMQPHAGTQGDTGTRRPGPEHGAASSPPVAPADKPAAPAKKRWELLAKPEAAQAATAGAGAPPDVAAARALLPDGGGGSGTTTAHKLIQPARWAIPAEPLRTIYRSQTLHGQLLQAVHSDIPGQVKINLIVPVLDKFGYDTVILPRDTLIIAMQEGRVTYGATRLALKLEQLELPSGEVIDLRATVGDDAGSGGMKGKVNNHYGKLILGTGLSALLNIGIKTAVGTPGKNEFFRDPLQDAAQDVGQAVQGAATDIISRELQVRPTITIPAGTLCTLSLQENMQFNRVPLVAR